jgi:hypothetical protein
VRGKDAMATELSSGKKITADPNNERLVLGDMRVGVIIAREITPWGLK